MNRVLGHGFVDLGISAHCLERAPPADRHDGRRIRAAVIYEAVHGPDPYTPEEFAREYGVPLEAVREALDYVANNLPLIEAEREREAADVRARGLDRHAPS